MKKYSYCIVLSSQLSQPKFSEILAREISFLLLSYEHSDLDEAFDKITNVKNDRRKYWRKRWTNRRTVRTAASGKDEWILSMLKMKDVKDVNDAKMLLQREKRMALYLILRRKQ
jgi:hypothetical protein